MHDGEAVEGLKVYEAVVAEVYSTHSLIWLR